MPLTKNKKIKNQSTFHRNQLQPSLVVIPAICLNRLKIPFEELCKSLTPPDKDDTDVDSPNIMRRLLFCDFSEAKGEDRFYKEINDMNKVGNFTCIGRRPRRTYDGHLPLLPPPQHTLVILT